MKGKVTWEIVQEKKFAYGRLYLKGAGFRGEAIAVIVYFEQLPNSVRKEIYICESNNSCDVTIVGIVEQVRQQYGKNLTGLGLTDMRPF